MNMRLTALSLAVAATLIGACATKEEASAPNMLVAAKVTAVPVLDGNANAPSGRWQNRSRSTWKTA